MNPTGQDKNEFIDFSGIIKYCVSKWYVFVIGVVVCVALTMFHSYRTAPEYLVKANLLITQEDAGPDLGAIGAIFGSSASVDDEVFAVSSHTIYRNVAKELGLNVSYRTRTGFLRDEFQFTGYPVALKCDPSIPDTIRTGLSFKVKVNDKGLADVTVKARKKTVAEVEDAAFPVNVKTPYGLFTLEKTPDFPAGEPVKTNISFTGYDDAAEDIAEVVFVDIASRKSNVILLELESPSVDYAKAVLNAIIEQYNLRGLGEKNLKNRKTIEFIDSRLALLSDDLSTSESSIEKYKRDNGIVDLEADAQYQFGKKGQIEQALVASETEMQIVKLIKDFVSDPANENELVPATLAGSNQGQGTDSFVGAYNELILKRIELAQNAHAGNAALEAVDRQIEAMRKNLLSTVDKAYQAASVKVRELRSEMNAAQAALGNMPTQERQFRDIKRQQTIKEQLYLFLLKQREQSSMMLANSQMKGQIIDEAYALNEPLGMKNSMKLIIAFIGGILLAAGYLYLRRLLRDKFDSSEEFSGLTSVPVLGEMCADTTGESVVVRQGGSTSTAELFRLIRTNLQFMLGGNGNKVVLVTSTTSGEGKSFISINLASSFALLGKKVLLVGLDIRKPKLQEYLGLSGGRGFTEYISSDSISLESIIRRDAVMPGLDVITSGPVPPNPSELLADPRVDELFAKLRGMYDYIIIDSAPVGIVSDTFALVRISDATVYVCRVNYTTRHDVATLNNLHATDRFRKLSVVVNGTKPRRTYGYGEEGVGKHRR